MTSLLAVVRTSLFMSVLRTSVGDLPGDHEQLLELQKHVDAMSAATAESAVRAHAVSAVLLLGLVVEIIGALFLAGPALTAKQEPVMSLDASPGWQDLIFHDTDGDKRLNFLGAIGAVFLAVGFVIQFGGTLYSLGVSRRVGAAAVLFASAVAFALFYFLLGQSPEQSRSQKIRVLWTNFRRLLTPDFGCRCDRCNGRLDAATAAVQWRETPANKVAPFLHPPRGWHVGHRSCLDASGWFEPLRGLDGREEDAVRRATSSEFLSKVPDLEKWWADSREHAATLASARGRTAEQLMNPAEGEFRLVLKKVRRLRTGTATTENAHEL